MVDTISLEQALELKQIAEDLYESVQLPWTWHNSPVVPGGLLMSLAAAAAYSTIPSGFAIDTLQAHFLAGANSEKPLLQRVTRLSDGGRFITRVVTVEQADRKGVLVHATCSFVRVDKLGGPSMTHCVARKDKRTVGKITLDDLEIGRSRRGPFMKFQRLPLVYTGRRAKPPNPPPQSLTYTSVAQISPPISPPSPSSTTSPSSPSDKHNRLQALGIISLSDYHILDCPPTLHSLSFGLPAINDATRTPTYTHFERYTSLNHTIHFHMHDGFRSDELCYIEANSPWARGRRAEVHSSIFGGDGKLVASCVQGSYYVMKEDLKGERGVGGGKEGGGVGKL